MLDGRDSVLITRHGEHVAIVYPLRDPKRIPVEVRRRITLDLTSHFAERLGGEAEPSRSAPRDPVIDVYRRDVDRTLIRENLRKTPEQRLEALEALQRFAEEARKSKPRRRA